MLIREFVARLSEEEKMQVIAEYEELEANGSIGSCALRTHAENLSRSIDSHGIGIVIWMQNLAFECYRHFARKHIAGLT